MSVFGLLKEGDIFYIGEIKYIKIRYVYCGNNKVANAICIDEHSNDKGKLCQFDCEQNISHVS